MCGAPIGGKETNVAPTLLGERRQRRVEGIDVAPGQNLVLRRHAGTHFDGGNAEHREMVGRAFDLRE